jgi:hypothetical protein
MVIIGSYIKIHSGQDASGYACNPSYSGGRNQEDHGLKPTPGK